MFSNWKIPARLLDDRPPGEPSGVVTTDFNMSRTTPCPPIQTPRLLRQSTLPEISKRAAVPVLQRSLTRMPDMKKSTTPRSVAPPTPMEATHSNFNSFGVTQEQLGENLQPAMVSKAQAWMQKAPNVERKVIERLLRMTDKKNGLNKAMRRTLLPDARKSVEQWLDTAAENERQVALQFFSSLGGGKLIGSNTAEQKQRLKDVISTLKDGAAVTSVRGPQFEDDCDRSNSRLQYIRLLDPHTRQKRWMHTTWHHLPEYKNKNKVENWSSHYTKPHAPVPRHFVIHPDWG